MTTRKVKIESEELKRLFKEKEDIVNREKAMVEEHNKFREDFAERTKAIKEEYRENEKKATKEASKHDIEVGEFEKIIKFSVENGETFVVIKDIIEEFKEMYRDSLKKEKEGIK